MGKSRNKKPTITRKNHYVPQWYQKRFMEAGQTQYWCLDKGTNSKPYLSNTVDAFQQSHLYTIDLFGQKSDIVERKLFGDIDGKGLNAIDIIAAKDGWQTNGGHEEWQDFIGFMNAQKLRTPKGLDWIKKYLSQSGFGQNTLNNNIVLDAMQQIRYLYCSMWTEAIWEIVSADSCEVKFVASDNPVTFYNYEITPDSLGNKYPDEPLLTHVGTQTIYPLSLNHCLILTHREMALEPMKINPLDNRTNARFFDDANNRAIFSFDDIIYERILNDTDVHIINNILKVQSKRFIAAAKKSWLYPENKVDEKNWKIFYKTLLPPNDSIKMTTGIFMGHRDGSVEGYDPYGQKITDAKEIKEIKRCEKIIRQINRKDNFTPHLTELLNQYDTPNLEEQNKLFIEGITDIFEMKKHKNMETFKDNFNADKVKKLYHLIDDLWPVGTDIFETLPQEDNLSLFYSGEFDFELLPHTLLNFSLYFDKIYIVNPFPAPCATKEKFNPIYIPEQHLSNTYNLLISMFFLLPWIETNQVQLVPCPFYLDFKFRELIMERINERIKSFDPQKHMNLYCRQLVRQFEQIFLMTPDKALEKSIISFIPGLPEEAVLQLAKSIREKKKNPLVWNKSVDNIGPQFTINKICEDLETTLYLSKLTNSIPYTYLKIKEDEFENNNSQYSFSVEYNIKTLNHADPFFVKACKDSGVMEEVRSSLLKLKSNPNSEELQHEFKEAISSSDGEWKIMTDILNKKNERYTLSDNKIKINIGQFDVPLIDNHLKSVYGKSDLPPTEMYLSTDLKI